MSDIVGLSLPASELGATGFSVGAVLGASAGGDLVVPISLELDFSAEVAPQPNQLNQDVD